MGLRYHAGVAAELDLPEADQEAWRAVGADPERLLNDPDFCAREYFVVTMGHVPG
jgi:hypothetical protein